MKNLSFWKLCLSPQAYFLNALYYRYPTISIIRPTPGFWISSFYSSFKSIDQKEAEIFFWQIIHRLSKSVSNVIDFFHNNVVNYFKQFSIFGTTITSSWSLCWSYPLSLIPVYIQYTTSRLAPLFWNSTPWR